MTTRQPGERPGAPPNASRPIGAHFADRLAAAIRNKNAPVCVGLDPLVERFPVGLRTTTHRDSPRQTDDEEAAAAMRSFGSAVIRAVAPFVPAIKINVAFFERYHAPGVRTYFELVREAHLAGLLVIGDVKRADIGHSSAQYAFAHLGESNADDADVADAVTVNPYFGVDGVAPFIDAAQKNGRGIFVLVQTSNESAAQVQGLTLADGSTVSHAVARQVQGWSGADGLIGDNGYSCVGAVVSPRDVESTERIRALMPTCIFLVPGFGAQGRTADEVAKCFKPDGTGAIVNASRSVIYAYEDAKLRDRFGDDWPRCVAEGCKDFVAQIRTVLG